MGIDKRGIAAPCVLLVSIRFYLYQFPAQKCRTIKKLFARDWIAKQEGARLPYFTRTGGHHECIIRKVDPALRLLTNRGWENHLFALLVFARDYSFSAKTDNSIDTGLGKLLGYYPNNQHEMLHTDAAQQRSGNSPASAPEASQQKSPRPQKQANPGRPVSQRRKSQPGDTTAVDRTAGTMGTSHINLIYDGLAPPPPGNSTPHAATPTLHLLAPIIIGRAQYEHRAQPAQYHPPEEVNEQAGSSSLQLRRESTPHATTVPYTLQPTQPTTKAKPRPQRMILPARYPPLGEGNEQAKHVLGQEQPGLSIKNKHENPADRESLQEHGNAPTTLQLSHDRMENAMIRLQRLARAAQHHPLGEGYEQTGSSSLHLRRESTPHATFAPCTLQPTQPTTNAKPRLQRMIVPGHEQAKQGMGQKQLGLTMKTQQKNPADRALQ